MHACVFCVCVCVCVCVCIGKPLVLKAMKFSFSGFGSESMPSKDKPITPIHSEPTLVISRKVAVRSSREVCFVFTSPPWIHTAENRAHRKRCCWYKMGEIGWCCVGGSIDSTVRVWYIIRLMRRCS